MKNNFPYIGGKPKREELLKMFERFPHRTFVEIDFHGTPMNMASPNLVAKPSKAQRKGKK